VPTSKRCLAAPAAAPTRRESSRVLTLWHLSAALTCCACMQASCIMLANVRASTGAEVTAERLVVALAPHKVRGSGFRHHERTRLLARCDKAPAARRPPSERATPALWRAARRTAGAARAASAHTTSWATGGDADVRRAAYQLTAVLKTPLRTAGAPRTPARRAGCRMARRGRRRSTRAQRHYHAGHAEARPCACARPWHASVAPEAHGQGRGARGRSGARVSGSCSKALYPPPSTAEARDVDTTDRLISATARAARGNIRLVRACASRSSCPLTVCSRSSSSVDAAP